MDHMNGQNTFLFANNPMPLLNPVSNILDEEYIRRGTAYEARQVTSSYHRQKFQKLIGLFYDWNVNNHEEDKCVQLPSALINDDVYEIVPEESQDETISGYEIEDYKEFQIVRHVVS